MTEQTDVTAASRWLTWTRCGWIVTLVMLVGVGLAATRPVWLAPPRVDLTPLVYLILAFLWLPVLIICALLRPAGRARIGVLVLVMGLLVSGGWCAFFNVNAGWRPLLGSTFQCRTEPIPETALVRHTCTRSAMFLIETYILEGPEGSPFAWLVDIQQTGT